MIRPGTTVRRYSLAATALFTIISLPALMVHARGPKPPTTAAKANKSKGISARSAARPKTAVKPTKATPPAAKPKSNSVPKAGAKYPVKVAARVPPVPHVRILPIGFDKPPSAIHLTALTNAPKLRPFSAP